MADITDENFNEMFRKFFRETPDDWQMLRPPAMRVDPDLRCMTGQQSEAWLEYLAAKGFHRRLQVWRDLIGSGKPVMVPCANPGNFDLTYQQVNWHDR